MNKVVINKCYGGFDLSGEALNWMREHRDQYDLSNKLINELNSNYPYFSEDILPRHSKILVDCVETLKKKASTGVSDLTVVEIKGDRYMIMEYDGMEEIITPEEGDWVVIE